MNYHNIVFIAKSLDGFIAGKNGELDWLYDIPNPGNIDMGYQELMDAVDAVVMGRKTFDTVCAFGGEWPYPKHVFVLSHSITTIPKRLNGKITILKGDPLEVLDRIHLKGYHRLYIDGGSTIQQFLKVDQIDEMVLTTIPILLGGGYPLFGTLDHPIKLQHVKSTVFLNQIVQDTYRRIRKE